jgi:tetratricopeptide (TPR) repeat protein
VQLGAAHLALGQLEPAERAFKAATTLRPGDVQGRLGLGQIHLRRGQARSAEAVADDLIAHLPGHAEARLLKANALVARGERAGARKQVEQALGAAPDHVPGAEIFRTVTTTSTFLTTAVYTLFGVLQGGGTVPEPASLALGCLGLLALAGVRGAGRRRVR